MKIQIKNRYDGTVLFETDAETIGGAVAAALKAKASLRYADLRYADLRYADLSSADLSSANLRYADLRSADLSSANLRYADLSSANLRELKASNKDLERIVTTRTILPNGDLVGWKKLQNGVVCELKIPADAKRVGGLIGRKCRAEYAIVVGDGGLSMRNSLEYKKGERVTPDKFDPNPFVECSSGIHFFITMLEAEEYTG